MSGGSMGYVYSAMESGRIDEFSTWHPEIVEEIERAYRDLLEGRVRINNTDTGKVVAPSTQYRMAADVAVPAMLAQIARAATLIAQAQSVLAEISDVAKAAEWRRSGDYGADDVLAECIAWMSKRIGIPLPKL